jgi:hypothetical protein
MVERVIRRIPKLVRAMSGLSIVMPYAPVIDDRRPFFPVVLKNNLSEEMRVYYKEDVIEWLLNEHEVDLGDLWIGLGESPPIEKVEEMLDMNVDLAGIVAMERKKKDVYQIERQKILEEFTDAFETTTVNTTVGSSWRVTASSRLMLTYLYPERRSPAKPVHYLQIHRDLLNGMVKRGNRNEGTSVVPVAYIKEYMDKRKRDGKSPDTRPYCPTLQGSEVLFARSLPENKREAYVDELALLLECSPELVKRGLRFSPLTNRVVGS